MLTIHDGWNVGTEFVPCPASSAPHVTRADTSSSQPESSHGLAMPHALSRATQERSLGGRRRREGRRGEGHALTGPQSSHSEGALLRGRREEGGGRREEGGGRREEGGEKRGRTEGVTGI